MPRLHSQIKAFLAFKKADTTSAFTSLLIVGLLGTHLMLMTVGAFCVSTTTNSDPAHHKDHQASTSILCVWACQVAQIAASATPTENLAILPLLILLGIILPCTIPILCSPFAFASPRGPPFV